MNVSLTPELERLVRKKIESGLYNNASEVIRESLRLLVERDQVRTKWGEQIERGWLQAQTGQLADGAQTMAELRRGLKQRTKKRT